MRSPSPNAARNPRVFAQSDDFSLFYPRQCRPRGACAHDGVQRRRGTRAGTCPAITRWVADQLQPEHARFIASLAGNITARRSWPRPGAVLPRHPRQRHRAFYAFDTRSAFWCQSLKALHAAVVVCGHTHMQFDRTIGAIRVVNAGSVGMPYGEPGAAYWLVLGLAIEFHRTSYDRAQAAARILATDYPQAEESFAAQNVVHLPSEAEALEVFTRMEIFNKRGRPRLSRIGASLF